MDFIEQLPPSEGYTDILVIVDRLTKQAIFVPTTRTIDATGLARLFIEHVVAKHSTPSHVTSDRGVEFVSKFFRSLADNLDMKLHFTLGYHPEADGQTERTNQTLEQFLRIYCNYQQSDWVRLLPLTEFTYNNSPSSTTGVFPFFANKGYHPKVQFQVKGNLTPGMANEYAPKLEEIHTRLKKTIWASQHRYQVAANRKHSPSPEIQIGDQVFVLAKFIRTTRPSRKLVERYLGPFEVTGQPGTHSYRVKLPNHLRTIHPVFHVLQLELAHTSSIPKRSNPKRSNPPPPPIEIDGQLEFEVAKVLDAKVDCRRKNPLLYYVQWTRYEGSAEEYSWVPATDLTNATELVTEFHHRYPGKPGPKNCSNPRYRTTPNCDREPQIVDDRS